MPAKLEKTKMPGIFKRGNRYAVIYRDGEGRQRQESARTYDEARRLRSTREASVSEGSYQSQTRERFADYAEAWIERYQGTGRRGFAEHTRSDYRRDLKAYAFPRLGRLRLERITPRHIAEFVALALRREGARVPPGRRDSQAHPGTRQVVPSHRDARGTDSAQPDAGGGAAGAGRAKTD